MSKEFSKYPLVAKAVDEQKQLARFLGGSLPPALIKLWQRSTEIIDQCIDLPAQDKESLMVAGVLLMASPFTFDDTDRFSEEYNERIHAYVNLISSSSTPFNDPKAPFRSSELLLAMRAMNIAAGEMTLAEIKSGKTRLTQQEMQQALDANEEQKKELGIVQGQAPKLDIMEKDLLNKIADALADKTPAHKKKPPSKKTDGPSL